MFDGHLFLRRKITISSNHYAVFSDEQILLERSSSHIYAIHIDLASLRRSIHLQVSIDRNRRGNGLSHSATLDHLQVNALRLVPRLSDFYDMGIHTAKCSFPSADTDFSLLVHPYFSLRIFTFDNYISELGTQFHIQLLNLSVSGQIDSDVLRIVLVFHHPKTILSSLILNRRRKRSLSNFISLKINDGTLRLAIHLYQRIIRFQLYILDRGQCGQIYLPLICLI